MQRRRRCVDIVNNCPPKFRRTKDVDFLFSHQFSTYTYLIDSYIPDIYVFINVTLWLIVHTCHWERDSSTLSRYPVVCGAKKPLKLATVLHTAKMAPACAGAKSKGL